jgi:hypothetical protein
MSLLLSLYVDSVYLQHFAWPPVQHLQDVEYKPHLVVQVIHIHDQLMHMNERFSRDVLEAALKPLLAQHQVTPPTTSSWHVATACAAYPDI